MASTKTILSLDGGCIRGAARARFLGRLLSFVGIIPGLNGCGANYYAVHKLDQFPLDKPAVLSVDAKQRFLISNVEQPVNSGTKTDYEMLRRFCAEPSPDVFTVLGQAASAGGSFGKSANPGSMDIALNGAFSSSETGSTIARTQTINMLKEMMYRTCERYMNGAINKDQFAVIAARDQRVMTSILAIEQLTGTVLPKPVVIAVNGNAPAGQSTTDAIKILSDAKNKADTKKGRLNTAKYNFEKIDGQKESCKTLMDKKEADVKAEEKDKRAKCIDLQGKLDQATADYNDAEGYYDKLANLAGKPGPSSAVTAAALLSSSGAATNTALQIEPDKTPRVTAVADVVDNIVSQSFNQDDETSFFCYGELKKNDPESVISKNCTAFLMAKLQNQTAKLRADTEKIIKMTEYKSDRFEQFWNKIKTDGSDRVDSQKLRQRIKKNFPNATGIEKRQLDEMEKATTKRQIRRVFDGMSDFTVDELLKD